MQKSTRSPQSSTAPSVWVNRFLPPISQVVLCSTWRPAAAGMFACFATADLPCARSTAYTTALSAFGGALHREARSDSTSRPTTLGSSGHDYDGIIVTHYLHRPLLPAIARALAPGGVLIYETFARGNERFGRPYAIPISCFAPASCSKPLQRLRSSPSNREGFGTTPRRDPAPCCRTRPDGPVAEDPVDRPRLFLIEINLR